MKFINKKKEKKESKNKKDNCSKKGIFYHNLIKESTKNDNKKEAFLNVDSNFPQVNSLL